MANRPTPENCPAVEMSGRIPAWWKTCGCRVDEHPQGECPKVTTERPTIHPMTPSDPAKVMERATEVLSRPVAAVLRWPLVRVTWVDSTGPRMWTRLTDVIDHHDMTVESVGWLVQDDADRIAIAAHVQPPKADNPMLDGVLTIPTCAITRRVVIAEPG